MLSWLNGDYRISVDKHGETLYMYNVFRAKLSLCCANTAATFLLSTTASQGTGHLNWWNHVSKSESKCHGANCIEDVPDLLGR